MAKKKKSTKVAKKKSGKGKKTCPSCGKLIGARTATCKCGHKFTTKKKKKKGSSNSTAVQQIQAASDLISLAGGSGEAKAIIEALNKAPF